MTIRCKEHNRKSPGDTANYAMDCTELLTSAEVLTGTPTVADATAVLTISSVSVNAAALTDDGNTIAIGKAVKFTVAGGVAGTTYPLTVSAATDSTPAQTIVRTCILEVE
jgi:hypothetical protein